MNEGILIFKKQPKSKNPRFYLYSTDHESLLLVSEKQNDHDHEWVISQDSINLNKTNESFVGILIKSTKKYSESKKSLSNTFVGLINNHEIIRIRKIDNCFQNYNISFSFEQDDQKIDDNIQSLTQSNQDAYYTQSFEFKYESKVCLSINYVTKDEYLIKYSEPIDLFKAFCSALSIILMSSMQINNIP